MTGYQAQVYHLSCYAGAWSGTTDPDIADINKA